jgi:hypothetical protein
MRATGLGQMLRHRDRCCDEEQEDGVHRGAMVVVCALAAHVADAQMSLFGLRKSDYLRRITAPVFLSS